MVNPRISTTTIRKIGNSGDANGDADCASSDLSATGSDASREPEKTSVGLSGGECDTEPGLRVSFGTCGVFT